MSVPAFRPFFLFVGCSLIAADASAAVSFEKQILPVLEKKCVDCHRAPHLDNGKKKEPKGELRLDAAWAMLKGGESGPALVPGNLGKSYMYEVVTLPKDDDKFMPSKGDPLTPDELKLLKEWIESGADFGGWKGNMEGAPPDAGAPKVAKVREHEVLYKELEAGLRPAGDDAIGKAKAAGAQVFQLKADSPLLRVDFLTGVSACTDDKVAALLPLKEHIAQLDLGRTAITDAALKTVGQLPRLVTLDLRQTKITDAGLEGLSGLKKLRTINLFNTEISDAGVKSLTAIKSLKAIYLFQTKATEAGAKQLTAALPGAKVTLK